MCNQKQRFQKQSENGKERRNQETANTFEKINQIANVEC